MKVTFFTSEDKVILDGQINQLSGEIDTKVDSTALETSVNSALTSAKDSGEFKGDPGYSPVRGTDYWTEADKAEIKSYVDDAILGGAW